MHRNRINLVLMVCLVIGLFGISAPVGEASPLPTSYSEVGYVTAILPDGDLLWAGTHGGDLVRLNPATGEEQRFPYPTAGVTVRDLARDSRGQVWVATEGGGLGRFDGQTYVTYSPDNSDFPAMDVRTVLVDETERVWAGTDAGVAYFEDGTWVTYNSDNSGLASDDVTALAVGRDVWCGTDVGLSVLAKGRWGALKWATFQTTNSGLPHNHITALTLTDSGQVWVGTERGAAWTGDGSGWWTNPTVEGVVRDILVDGNGAPWFNLGQYVGYLTDCNWSTYDASVIGVKATSIAAIALDTKGRLWAGAEGGLAMLQPPGTRGVWATTEIKQPVSAMALKGEHLWLMSRGAATRYDLATGEQTCFLPEYGLGAEVRSMAVDEQGWVWFATWGHGLTVFDGNGWEVYTTGNSQLPSDHVSSAAAVPGGGVLFGTSAGLTLFEDGVWRTYPADEIGLQDELVTAVAAAGDGRIAVGAYGSGVSVYDGQVWTRFDTANSHIPSDYIQTLAFDPLGVLWVGTQGDGVARFDGTQWTTYRSGPGGPGGDFVHALVPDAQGNVWLGTEDGGLSQFDGCVWTVYDVRSENTPVSVYALAADPGGEIWLGTEEGLLSFDPPVPYPFEVPSSPRRLPSGTPVPATAAPRTVAQAAPDTDQWITHGVGKSVHNIAFADDVLWSSTLYGGAVQWNTLGEFKRFLFPQDGIGGNQVVYTAVDPLGRIWCATHERGVSVYDGVKWIVYNTGNSGLSRDNVNGIAFGSFGQIWFATLGGGVSMFDGQNWTTFNTENSGLAGDFVWYVAVGPQGRLWFGCMAGLSVYDGQTWYTYPDTSNVHCVAFDSQGRTWFGDGMALNLVDGQSTIDVSRDQLDVYTRDVYAIAFDDMDNTWLGTGNGIFRYDGQQMVQFDTETTGLRGQQVFAAAVGPDGRVWFGADDEDGIASFDGTSWQHYSTASGPNPLSTNVIESLVDTQGRIWLGTDRGVSVYDGATWIGYTPGNSGLVDERVQAIAQDPLGRMWFGTPKGISVFDGANWTVVIPESAGPLSSSVDAILFDNEGRAWAGGLEGVSVFDGQSWQSFTPDNSPLAGKGITSLAMDRQGRIWMGSSWAGGISVFDGGQWTVIQPEEYGQNVSSVSAIAVDLGGNIWVGTGIGISVFDGSQWMAYNLEDLGLACRSVSAFAFDSGGGVWIAGYGGVDRLDAGNWTHYTPGDSPLVGGNVRTLAIDRGSHVWIGVAEGGASELIPGARRALMPPTPVPTPTWTPYVPPATPTPLPPPPTVTPVPTAAAQVTGLDATGIFVEVWKQLGAGNGPVGWATAPAEQIFCADQRFQNGYMFWRSHEPRLGPIYVLTYDGESQDTGKWRVYTDTWDDSQPSSGGYTPPPNLYEPVRGFGKVWRDRLGGAPPPPPMGWAVEGEQGLDGAQTQDFEGATMLYSPRLNRIFVLFLNGTWRAFPAQ